MANIRITVKPVKITKNFIRFEEEVPARTTPFICNGTIYLDKSAFSGRAPEEVFVTFDWED